MKNNSRNDENKVINTNYKKDNKVKTYKCVLCYTYVGRIYKKTDRWTDVMREEVGSRDDAHISKTYNR